MKSQDSKTHISQLKKFLFGIVFFCFILLFLEFLVGFAGLDKFDHQFMPRSSYPVFVKGQNELAGSFVTSSHFHKYINQQTFPQTKNPDTFRIFIIGGSAAYAWPNLDKYGFTGHLRRAFDSVMPGKVEIINAAGLSYGSHRVLDVLQDVLLHEPDLVIVFSGNNEYVELNVLPDNKDSKAGLERLGVILGHTNIYKAVRLGLFKIMPSTFSTPQKPDITDIRSDPDFERGALGRTDEIDQEVLENYRTNLASIRDLLINQKVKAIFCTVPVNIGGWLPKVGDPQFVSENDAMRWQKLYEQKEKAFLGGDIRLEAKYLEQMLAIAPEDPGILFNYGKVLWNLGQNEASYKELVMAKDFDLRPIRALSSFNESIKNLIAVTQGVYLADLETNFKELYFNRIAEKLFLDYCHFTDDGHKTVARMLLPIIQKAMTHNIPIRQLESRIVADRTAFSKDKTEKAAELFAKAMTMQNNGMIDETIKTLEKILKELPEYNSALTNLGTIYFKKGEYKKAKNLYLSAIAVHPDNIEALTSLGYIALNSNKLAEAENHFMKAYRLNPYAPTATTGIAYIAIQQGAPNKAKQFYEKTLELGRDSFTLRRGLGEAYHMLGDKEKALRNWKIALQFRPNDQETRSLVEKYSR